jgi:hypothetical protein
MTRQSMVWLLGVAVGFLALIGVGASVAHYLQQPYILALLIVANPTDAQNALLWDASFAVAFVLNTSVAELWIRATRRSGAPRARKVKAA